MAQLFWPGFDQFHTSGVANEVTRAYAVQVLPVAGKTWGEVVNFKDDVVVLAARQ